MDDRNLEKLARGLGREAAERIDPDVVAQRVLQRLRDEPVVAAVWYRRGAFRVAAAAVVVLATTFVLRGQPDEVAAPVFPNSSPAFVLDALSDEELGEMLDSLDIEAPMVEVMKVGFYDLDEDQLVDLLESLED